MSTSQDITRRNFVASAAGALALGTVGMGSALAEESAPESSDEPFELGVDWSAEYDVVVIGFGGAGANTAIAAADEGAKVLILEKAPEADAGGSSIVCWQLICYAKDRDRLVTYMKAMRGNYESPSDEMIEAYADGVMENYEWMQYLGVEEPVVTDTAEWPELEGSDSFQQITVHEAKGDGAAFKVFKDNVLQRSDKIDIWYKAPATGLIQDPITKIVHGVKATVDGAEINIRARNGVVLALGGFENSPGYQQNYLAREFWPSLGRAIYNTGDGIPMAQSVGARMWHMSNFEINPIEFCDPDTLEVTWQYVSNIRGILVGGNGKRFANEMGLRGRHGHIDWGGTYVAPPLPDVTYEVMDQAMLSSGPAYPTWSPDNSLEIERGWILQADTLEELAEKMGLEGDAITALPTAVEEYNHLCEEGRDWQFERDPETMTPFGDGPFYAVPLCHSVVNTQGGPEKDVNGQVISADGTPIPHLYEAGEFGDIWSHCYQASCNLGGGLIFGRISGRNAAAPKTDNYQDSVMAGKENYVPQDTGLIPEDPTAGYEAGENEHIGWSMGKRAPLVVKVTMDGDTITDVEILEHDETVVISDYALVHIPEQIVATNSTVVDIIAGATATCVAIMEAVRNAIEG